MFEKEGDSRNKFIDQDNYFKLRRLPIGKLDRKIKFYE